MRSKMTGDGHPTLAADARLAKNVYNNAMNRKCVCVHSEKP